MIDHDVLSLALLIAERLGFRWFDMSQLRQEEFIALAREILDLDKPN